MEESRDSFALHSSLYSILSLSLSLFDIRSHYLLPSERKTQRVLPQRTDLPSFIGATGCSGANQQDSPKPTVVALVSARRGAFSRERARARARARARVCAFTSDRDARTDRRDRTSDSPASSSAGLRTSLREESNVSTRDRRDRSSHSPASRSSRNRTIMAADVTASLVFLLARHVIVIVDVARTIPREPDPSTRTNSPGAERRARAERDRRGTTISRAETRLSDADGGVALPTPSRDAEPIPGVARSRGRVYQLDEPSSGETERERESRVTAIVRTDETRVNARTRTTVRR